MIKELSAYQNLGTPHFFWELINAIKYSDGAVTQDAIAKLYFNRIIEGRNRFDGCLALSKRLGIVDVNASGALCLNPMFDPISEKQVFIDKFINRLFEVIKDDAVAKSIFSECHLGVDLGSRSIKVSNKAFGFKYSNFKQFLLDFGILRCSSIAGYINYYIDPAYLEIFKKTFVFQQRKGLSPDELKSLQAMNDFLGLQAELFVLEYERNRLGIEKPIVHVSILSASEGFDIASFESSSSTDYDRFIEVKSYSGPNPYFFWSKGEISTAHIKGDKYFLYLVDRDLSQNLGYSPKVIRNPYRSVMESESWSKEVERYYVTSNGLLDG